MAQTNLLTLKKQLATGAFLLVPGIVITCLFQSRPWFHEWRVGIAVWMQLIVSLGFGSLAALSAAAALRLRLVRRAMVVPPAMQSIKLTVSASLGISLAAGVSEEILFRAALQPLIGIWLASGLFALAHLRTAAIAKSLFKKAIYIANVFLAGLGLGLVFHHIGLVAAILMHASVDLVALVTLRRLQEQTHVKALPEVVPPT